jgi:DNA-binding response OmpR family regulator
MKGDQDKVRAAGCDHYVTKPYSPLQLLRTIRGILGAQGRDTSGCLGHKKGTPPLQVGRGRSILPAMR